MIEETPIEGRFHRPAPSVATPPPGRKRLPEPAPATEPELRAVARLAGELGADDLAREATELAGRLAAGRSYVACVGMFNRGKSTLINALVGAEVLPAGVLPVTSVITVVRHAPAFAARVRYRDGRVDSILPERIAEFVSESHNPGNAKHVEAVEVFVPSTLLADGMCLVDTPGLGSVWDANTTVTEDFLPRVDGLLAVLGADPPLSAQELEALVRAGADRKPLVLVMNKADRLDEGDLDAASRFATAVLSKRLGRTVEPPLRVSALDRLAGRATMDWARLEARMGSLAQGAGTEIVSAARTRGLDRLAATLLGELRQREDAITRPRESLDAALIDLRTKVARAERMLGDVDVLLEAEERRVAGQLRTLHGESFRSAQERAREELAKSVRALQGRRGALHVAAMRAARDVARRTVKRYQAELEPVAEALYRGAVERFMRSAEEALRDIRASAGVDLGTLPEALDVGGDLERDSRLFYTSMMHLTSQSVWWVAARLVSRVTLERIVVRRIEPYLDALVEANSSRVTQDLIERVTRSRVRLRADLRRALGDVLGAGERAIARAQRVRDEGQDAASRELARIEELRRGVIAAQGSALARP